MAIKQSLLVVLLSTVLLCSPRLTQADCSGGPKGNPAYPNSAPANSDYKNQCPCAFGSFCDTTLTDQCKDLPYGCSGGTYMPNCYSGGSAPSCLTCPANYYCPQYGSRSALIPGPVACPAGKTSRAGSDGGGGLCLPFAAAEPPPAAAAAAAAAYIRSVPWMHRSRRWQLVSCACGLLYGNAAECGGVDCWAVGCAQARFQCRWLGFFDCKLLRLERRRLHRRCDGRGVCL